MLVTLHVKLNTLSSYPGVGILWPVSHTGAAWVLPSGWRWTSRCYHNFWCIECKSRETNQIWLWIKKSDIRFLQWTFNCPHVTVDMIDSCHISNDIGLEFYTHIDTRPIRTRCSGGQKDIVRESTSAVKITEITKFMGPTWAHLDPVGPRWALCWPHEPSYQGTLRMLWGWNND